MRRCVSLGVFLLLTAGVAPVRGQTTLAWDLKKDATFYVMTVSTCEQNLDALEKQARQKLVQATNLAIKVLDKTADQAVLQVTIDETSIAPRGEEVVNRFGGLIKGTSFKVTLGPNMQVKQLDGYQDLVKKLAGDDAEARRSVEALLSEEALRKSLTQVFTTLPAKPMTRGETWKQETTETVAPLGTAKRTTVYKYEGKGKLGDRSDFDVISFTGTAALSADKAPAVPTRFQVVKADLKADDVKGTIWLTPRPAV
jgi:hypothetical protein